MAIVQFHPRCRRSPKTSRASRVVSKTSATPSPNEPSGYLRHRLANALQLLVLLDLDQLLFAVDVIEGLAKDAVGK